MNDSAIRSVMLIDPSRYHTDPSFHAAREICRTHARSFYFASHFLPRPKRYAAYAVYAFCRLLDDAVDEAGTPEQQRVGLAKFRSILARCFDRNPPADQPALAAFSQVVSESSFNILPDFFEELATGCEMDLSITRYDTWEALDTYCYRVAGVVGLMMSGIFGLSDPLARDQAVLMGKAMQLTNILRDVGEDFLRGRIYLPRQTWAGDMEKVIAGRQVTPDLVATIAPLIARARSMFTEAAVGLIALPADGSRGTACVMSVVYAGILGAIERQNYDVLKHRAKLSTTQKLARLPAAFKLARRHPGEPVPDVF